MLNMTGSGNAAIITDFQISSFICIYLSILIAVLHTASSLIT